MTKIPTIQEAQQALTTLQRFLTAMSTMFGQVAEESHHPARPRTNLARRERILGSTLPARHRSSSKMTWKQKLAEILRESDGPLLPKQITDEYVRRFGWDEKRSKLGNRIRSTLLFMKNDGEISVDADGNYSVTTQEELLR